MNGKIHYFIRESYQQEDCYLSRDLVDLGTDHYLKFGQTDQRNIGRVPLKLFRGLYNKSRDEIEHGFMDMEAALSPREYKTYTYTIYGRLFAAVYQQPPRLSTTL